MVFFKGYENVSILIDGLHHNGIAIFNCSMTAFRESTKGIEAYIEDNHLSIQVESAAAEANELHSKLHYIFDKDKYQANSEYLSKLIEKANLHERLTAS